MKKILFAFLTFIFLISVYSAPALAQEYPHSDITQCRNFSVSLNVEGDWPDNDPLQIFCKGWSSNTNAFCPGQENTPISPGQQNISVDYCDCKAGGDCLQVDPASIPQGCVLDGPPNKQACGQNQGHEIGVTLNIKCPVITPPPPDDDEPPECPNPRPYNKCEGNQCKEFFGCPDANVKLCTRTSSIANECAEVPPQNPTTVPQCNAICETDANCALATDGCTQCINKICQPPPQNPTGPQCNSPCQTRSECIGDAARNNCTECLQNPNGPGLTCQPPAGLPPVIPVPPIGGNPVPPVVCVAPNTEPHNQCVNGQCVPVAQCGLTNCDACPPPAITPPPPPGNNCPAPRSNPHSECNAIGQCVPVLTCGLTDCSACGGNPPPPIAPPPGVNPPPAPGGFNDNMCQCDGLDATALIPGQKAVITVYTKVTGADVAKAKVTKTRFTFAQADGSNAMQAEIPIADKDIIVNRPDFVRYKSNWEITIPANVKPNVPYRIDGRGVCASKIVSQANPQTGVLGVATKQANFLDDILNFFRNLFGGGNNQQPNQTTPPPPQTTNQTLDQQQLQLKPIRPAQITQKQCTALQFVFKEQ
jgi:hypothetical protein